MSSGDALFAALDAVSLGAFRTTPDGRMLQVNDTLVRLMGYEDRASFLAVPVPSLYAEPAKRAEWRERMEREGVVKGFETSVRHRDGRVLWVRITARAERDADGRVLWFDGLIEDVTQRRVAEDELRRTTTLLQGVFDALDDALILVSWPDRRIVRVNRACERIYGYAEDELVGQSTEVFHVDHARFLEFGRRIGEFFAQGQEARLPYEMKRRNGEVFPTEHVTKLLRGPDGGIIAGLAITRDVTALRRSEAELAVARRRLAHSEKLAALGSLVAGVAHEIRTPLAYIANNVEILARRAEALPDAAEARALADSAREGIDRINRIVLELRRFSRKEERRVEPADPALVVQSAIDLFRAASRGSVEVRADLQGCGPLPLDRSEVEQLVLNLLDNAADASPIGGVVEVTLQPLEEGVELCVRDHGPGIPEELRARVFDEFFTTKRDGNGLGLSIVRRIALAHGGSVRCESQPGKGTRFVVVLKDPRAAPAVA